MSDYRKQPRGDDADNAKNHSDDSLLFAFLRCRNIVVFHNKLADCATARRTNNRVFVYFFSTMRTEFHKITSLCFM